MRKKIAAPALLLLLTFLLLSLKLYLVLALNKGAFFSLHSAALS